MSYCIVLYVKVLTKKNEDQQDNIKDKKLKTISLKNISLSFRLNNETVTV